MTITPLGADLLAATRSELYGFRDQTSGLWLRFYTPAMRFDLWRAYIDGARSTYRRFRVENALRLPTATPQSFWPIFAVAVDDDGTTRGGWYTMGPLAEVSHAHAPSEFASEPYSAALIVDWISSVLDEGVMEMKAAWVDPSSEHKSAIADLLARSYLHAMGVVGVKYAFGTAAEHAAPRWRNSGAQTLPGIVLAAYPDERYRTTFLWWGVDISPYMCSEDQQELYFNERDAVTGAALNGRR